MFVWVYFWALYSVSLSNLSILFPIPPYDYRRFIISVKFSSIQFSRPVMSNSLWPHGPQHARFPCPSPTPKLAKTHVHWVGDAIQPSHPLSSPSPPAFNLYQHQGLLQWASILWGFPHPFSIVLINFGSFDLQYLKKRIYWDFIWIALNLYIKLGRIDILTTLSLPIHGYGIFLHLLIFSLIFCNQSFVVLFLYFLCTFWYN